MPRTRLLGAVSLLASLILVMSSLLPAALVAHAASGQASIQVSRLRAAPGDHVVVSGTDFTPRDTIVVSARFTVNGKPQTVQSPTTSNDVGSFQVSLAVPAGTNPGVYTVNARDLHGKAAHHTLTVLALAVLDVGQQPATTTVVADHLFYAVGSGFKPGEAVQISVTFPQYNGTRLTVSKTATASSAGRIGEVLLQIPRDSMSGTYTLTATGATSGHTATAKIDVVYRPYLVLNPPKARPGMAITVNGFGFVPNSTIQISIAIARSGAAGTTLTVGATTGDKGSFTAGLNLPLNTSTGTYTVKAYDTTGKFTAQRQLTVTLQPVVVLATHTAAPGTVIAVTGSGFSANATLGLRAVVPLFGGGDRTLTQTIHTDTQGNFATHVTVPTNAAAGQVRVTVSGPNTHASAVLTVAHVSVHVVLTPSTTAPGSSIVIHGTGYPANDTVTVSLNLNLTGGGSKRLTTSGRANAQGVFNATLQIPGTASVGAYVVQARSTISGRIAVARLTLSVHASIALQPAAALPSQSVTLTGGGFSHNVPVTITGVFPLYGGGSKTVRVQAQSNAQGAVSTRLAIPGNAAAGSVLVTASGPNTRATAGLLVRHVLAAVSISPATVIPGGSVSVKGTSFPANDTINITVSGAGGTILTMTVHTGPRGGFTAALHLPATVAGGTYSLVARSISSGRAPGTRLVVAALKPSVVASPAMVTPGTRVTVNGFGFAAGQTMSIALNGQTLASATTTAAGTFSTAITVPATAASGTYTVSASSSGGHHANAQLVVNRQISTHFYFASLYTGAGYHEYLALLNPSGTRGRVTITYQKTDGTTKTKQVELNAETRGTEDVNADIGFHVSAAATVSADVPIVAERLVYHNTSLAGGPGTQSPSRVWYFANGNTSGKYREYIAIQNPNTTRIQVGIRFLPTHHAPFTVYRIMLPTSRLTIKVNSFVRDAVGVTVNAGAPVVANRTMYFMRGMNSKAGVVAPHRTWYFAAGPQNRKAHNWIAAINPNGRRTLVTLHAYGPYGPFGQEVGSVTGYLRPGARAGYLMNKIAHATDVAVVLSATRPIVAEQTTYRGRQHNASTDVFGVASPAKGWGFAAVSTLAAHGESDVLDLYNPSLLPIPIVVQFMSGSGTVVNRTYVVGPLSHQSVDVSSVAPNAQLGIVATSNNPFVAMNRAFANNRRGAMTSQGVRM